MKDNFSTRSDNYAKYRPAYPAALFEYINALIPDKQNAWDCGTGNGQVAAELAKTFEHVYATDISQAQLDHAFQAGNISYSVQPAEKTTFENDFFDLIVVAQAIHWFDFDRFYAEVKRTARQHAMLCVVGYGMLQISPPVDAVIADFYNNVTGPYWDPERKYLDENYQTIPFPFPEMQTPDFVNTQNWALEHLIGYLNTWSAVKHFMKEHNVNPVTNLQKDLTLAWGNDQTKEVHFPILLRTGRITK